MRLRAWARASFAFGLPLCAVADFACNQAEDMAHVTLAPSLLFPEDTLGGVTALTLAVYDAVNGIGCNATTGQATGVTMSTPQSIPAPVLTSTGCNAGAKFCGTFQIGKSTTPRVFVATASGTSGVIAYGCAQQVINTDNAGVSITMLPYATPAVCGDGKLEFTEQCGEPTGSDSTFVCNNCQTIEEYLSAPDTGSGGTIAGAIGDKFRPQLTWPSGAGNDFFAVWGDRSPSPQTQIDMRILDDHLNPLASTVLGMEASVASMFLPSDPTQGLPPAKAAGDQFWPSVAYSTGKYYVAFQDDATPSGDGIDIHLRSMSAMTLTADQPSGAPSGINGNDDLGEGEPGVQNNPSIAAGPQGALYVVWQDSAGNPSQPGGPGAITGRLYTAGGALGTTQYVVSGGAAGVGTSENPIVAGTSSGWVVVWDDLNAGGNIWMSLVDSNGAPSVPVQVNQPPHNNGIQDHPWVAVVPGSSQFCVVWADHGATDGTDIAFQRFDTNGSPIAGDQAVILNNVNSTGEQVSATVAATTANGSAYVAAWYDQVSMHIRARYINVEATVASGNAFLPNWVNTGGTSDEFQVSLTPNHARANPAVVIGGAGPYVAIAWEDLDASKPGIFARRFPVPPTH